ncbi:MAG TPA: MFS transporter, partial [Planctomycetes bacterium]|nr:MFS transporter [Planctomycetota bacterium]
MSTPGGNPRSGTLFGHPCGLFTLFFAEMWERFSYYGMRALLIFYMIKGFLKYGDSDAYAVYGAYTALVYMTPFFGGMLADRLLGARRAVILGGLLMSAGHLMMTVEHAWAFFTALALLILGNGFFKPNISTIVGSLYPSGSPKRDGGFTIFYMGINLGAAMSPLLCGYIGETYGWHYGFGLATIGMLTGLAVFVAPSVLSQLFIACITLLAAMKILMPAATGWWIWGKGETLAAFVVLGLLAVAGLISLVQLRRDDLRWSLLASYAARGVIVIGALAAAGGLLSYRPENVFSMGVNVFVALSLVVAAGVAW